MTLSFVGLRSVKPRTEPVRAVVLHWTGGAGDLERLYKTLRARKGPRTPDGLSVHYGLQANGLIGRYAPEDLVTLHAGSVNPWTIGIEVTCPGFPGKVWDSERARGVARDTYTDRLRGRRVTMLGYTEAQYAALRAFLRDLCARHGLPYDFPREKDGALARRQLTPAELAGFRGVMGHFHCHPSKCDPGTQPFERIFG